MARKRCKRSVFWCGELKKKDGNSFKFCRRFARAVVAIPYNCGYTLKDDRTNYYEWALQIV